MKNKKNHGNSFGRTNSIDGTWGGKEGVDFDALPATMLIDYVGYYQKFSAV